MTERLTGRLRLVPRSLAGRLALLLVLAVVAAQAATFTMFAHESNEVGRAAARTQVVDRVATLVRLLDTVPGQAEPAVITAFSAPRHRFAIGPDSLVAEGAMGADESRLAGNIARRILRESRWDAARKGEARRTGTEARLALVDREPDEPARLPDARAHPQPRPNGKAFAPSQALLVSVRLDDGRWLNGEALFVAQTPPWMRIALYQLGASVLAVLAVVGLGLSGVVGPVRALAEAAEQAGRGAVLPPLPERGPREIRTMTAAFNRMQARLRAFVDDRTRMLAAISHDLRTPISSLWLRAEMVEDAEQRTAMTATLARMKRMVESTLTFAREDADAQESGPLDLAELLRALAEEHRALGRDVSLRAPETLPFHGRPTALRRALDNLVENAVRYGGRARIALAPEAAGQVAVTIDDDGPGVPPERVEEVFAPFARLEGSRSEETGGTGLGLSIARSAVRAHGGDIRLVNRPEGGLRAAVTLPVAEVVTARPPVPAEA